MLFIFIVIAPFLAIFFTVIAMLFKKEKKLIYDMDISDEEKETKFKNYKIRMKFAIFTFFFIVGFGALLLSIGLHMITF